MRTRRLGYVVVAAVLALALAVPGVAVAETGATRELPADPVAPGDEFEVGITVSDVQFGQVVETLPEGFTYQDVSDPSVSVTEEEDGVVKFTFIVDEPGEPVEFSYTVAAADEAGTYEFAGVLKTLATEEDVGGDTEVTVGEANGDEEAAAIRDLPAQPVALGDEFEVGITVSDVEFGQVVETLPEGFTYGEVSGDGVSAKEEDGMVKFTFVVDEPGEPVEFSYTVAAADEAGTYEFDGVLKTLATEEDVGGDTEVTVGEAVFEETFEGTLEEEDRDCPIVTIPAGATNLDIQLDATDDLDLELYDGDTLAVGWKGEIEDDPGGTYNGDAFEYSGYKGGEEFITADGPLAQPYDLCVFAYDAGDYTVDVYYEVGEAADVTPPEIDIDVDPAAPDVGELVTVTVTADDESGVAECNVAVTGPTADIAGAMSFGDEVSVSFIPGEAGTYTVDAQAEDEAGNPADATVDFEVT